MKKPLFVMLSDLPVGRNQPEWPMLVLFPAAGAENVNPDTHRTNFHGHNPIVGDSGVIMIYYAMSHQIVDSYMCHQRR